jgi:hypothetical protein
MTTVTTKTSIQAPKQVVMVRPHCFQSNPQTMADNSFQRTVLTQNSAESAYLEVTNAVAKLRSYGVEVHLFDDRQGNTPDSVFPNNWFSAHHNGMLITYPMYAVNRRLEYREDIIEFVSSHYMLNIRVDLRSYAEQQLYLEGTGSIVFDHQHCLAYACRSKRTNERLLSSICQKLGYQTVIFDAHNHAGVPVYHTNVLMCIGSGFVMICMDMVAEADRERLKMHFESNKQRIIELTEQQIEHFCGNAIELQGDDELILALSETAYAALTVQQKSYLETCVTLVPLYVPTIESAGGSVRCMIAGIHQP